MSEEFWNESHETVYQKKRFRRTGKRALKRMIEERDVVLVDVQDRLRVSESRVVELEGQLGEAGRQYQAAQTTAEGLKLKLAELEGLRAARAQLEGEVATAREALREEKAAGAARAAEAEERTRDVEAALEAARNERSIALQDAARKERQRAELADALDSLRREHEHATADILRLESEIAELKAKLEEAEAAPPFGETMARFLDEELRAVLDSSREAAAKMLETAEAESERKTAESRQLWESVRDEAGRYARWRAQFEPVLRSVHGQLEQLRAAVAEIPLRIEAAVEPVAEAFSAADADMDNLFKVLSPPELEGPDTFASEEHVATPRADGNGYHPNGSIEPVPGGGGPVESSPPGGTEPSQPNVITS